MILEKTGPFGIRDIGDPGYSVVDSVDSVTLDELSESVESSFEFV